MATRIVKQKESPAPGQDDPVKHYLEDPRLDLCLTAIQELDAMLEHIQRCIDDDGSVDMPRKTRAIMTRARSLSSAIQTGLGDHMATTEDVAAIVNLEAA